VLKDSCKRKVPKESERDLPSLKIHDSGLQTLNSEAVPTCPPQGGANEMRQRSERKALSIHPTQASRLHVGIHGGARPPGPTLQTVGRSRLGAPTCPPQGGACEKRQRSKRKARSIHLPPVSRLHWQSQRGRSAIPGIFRLTPDGWLLILAVMSPPVVSPFKSGRLLPFHRKRAMAGVPKQNLPAIQ
jgi:hypothetical protein